MKRTLFVFKDPGLFKIKLLLFFLLAVLGDGSLLAQSDSSVTPDTPWRVDFDPYFLGKTGSIRVGENENTAGKILNQQFSSLVSGQEATTVGNFASITPTDAKIDFAGSVITSRGSVFTMKASGKVTDGFLALFDNSKLNTQVSLDLKFHFLNLYRLSLSFNTDSGRLYDQKVSKIRYDFESQQLAINYDRSRTDLSKKDSVIKKEVDSLIRLRNRTMDNDTKSSISFEIGKRQQLEDSITQAIAELPSRAGQLRTLHDQTLQQLNQLSFSKGGIEGFEINWWTIGYKVNRNKFKLFYPTAQFSAQVTDNSFVTHEASLQWSYYRWSSQGFKTLFAAIGACIGYSDNFSTLDKNEISETTNYGPSNGERSVTKKYDAYAGDYQRNLATGKLYGDVYYFLFNKNQAALHVNPEWVVQSKQRPVGNVLTGLLLVLKKKDEETNVVNAELYYQFLNVLKTSQSDDKFFQRNSIGLRFTFPIQFK
jgi:hypothetical protein